MTGPGQEITAGDATIPENTALGVGVHEDGTIEVSSSNPIELDGPGPFNGEVSTVTFDSDGNVLTTDATGNLITPDAWVEDALKKELEKYKDIIDKIDDAFDKLNDLINSGDGNDGPVCSV